MTKTDDTTKINFGKVDPRLLEILACPLTKTTLRYDEAAGELISDKARLAFPVRDGIPIMLVEEAREIEG
ncbi:MAG: Trm112 family protein [Emcibacter sp.]|nr:Trm112 family protein [Emcibacter sp.]